MNYNKLSDDKKVELLKKLYIKEQKSFQQIADHVGSYSNRIRRDAIKLKIPIRTKSEAQKNALKNGTTKHPTQGKERPENVKAKIGLSVMENWNNLTDDEFKKRQKRAKESWDAMSDDQKERMVKLANDAVRSSSKTGSKLEKFLLDNLIRNGYRVEFHKEQNLLNTKLQIDIFLPELNTAIEVDGPSHFLPVWGEESLKRNIKYDNKKTGLLLGKGCAIIRIKQTKDFSPSRASLILSSVLDELAKIKNKFPEPNNRTIEIGD